MSVRTLHVGRARRGFTLIELVIALALAAVVMALVGSLIVASLSAWRRGSDLREAQSHAALLADVIGRDVRNASQAPSVQIRPRLPVEDGEPLLAVAVASPEATAGGAVWIAFVHRQDRGEVVRQRYVSGDEGTLVLEDTRVVTFGVERVTVEPTGGGVTVEVQVRRGKALATSRVTAVPRNP